MAAADFSALTKSISRWFGMSVFSMFSSKSKPRMLDSDCFSAFVLLTVETKDDFGIATGLVTAASCLGTISSRGWYICGSRNSCPENQKDLIFGGLLSTDDFVTLLCTLILTI